MKPPSVAAAFAGLLLCAGGTAPAASIAFTFTGLRAPVQTCTWFDDNLTDRSIAALVEQTDLLYNRLALPAGTRVTIAGTGVTALGGRLVDFKLGAGVVCTGAGAVYGAGPASSASPAPGTT